MPRITAIAALLAVLTLGAVACSNGDAESVASLPEDYFTYPISHVQIAVDQGNPNAAMVKVLKVLEELRSGRSIAAVAKKWSSNEASAAYGGWLGFLRPEEQDALTGAIRALPVGAASGPVQTEKGFEVFYRHTLEEGREIEVRYVIPAYGIFIPFGSDTGVTREEAEPRAREAWDRVNRGELTLAQAAKEYSPVQPPRPDAFIANLMDGGRLKEIYEIGRGVEPGALAPLGEIPGGFALVRRGEYFRSHVRHILIQHLGVKNRGLSVSRAQADAQALAEKILAELGGDTSKWAAAVRKYSDDTSTLALQGWVGAVTNGELAAEMEAAVLATEPGRIASEITESGSGYHILWRVN